MFNVLPPGPGFFLFFFNDTATTEIYTLSLHDALPISAPPTGLSVSALDATDMNLSWIGSKGGTAHNLTPATDASPMPSPVGTRSTTAFTDSGLSPSTTYFYRLVASNGTKDSAPSSVSS